MTNKELNKFVHEQILKLCWHEIDRPQYGDSSNCTKCGAFVHFEQRHGEIFITKNPDYCSDLNLATVVEKAVIEKVGDHTLLSALRAIVGVANYTSFATAEQRIRACVEAWRVK